MKYAIAICVILCSLSSYTLAKTTRSVSYRFNNVWSTAFRMIRVDKHYKVTDKDKDTGYILFVYPGKGSVKKCAASLELIASSREKPPIQLQISIAHQPSWVEIQFLDKLEQKLKAELGPPRQMDPPKKDKPKDEDKNKDKPKEKMTRNRS